jgi:hypothetical protein
MKKRGRGVCNSELVMIKNGRGNGMRERHFSLTDFEICFKSSQNNNSQFNDTQQNDTQNNDNE